MTVIEVDDEGMPRASAEAVNEDAMTQDYAAGHYPYPALGGISGLVRPGMLVDIRV